MNKPKLYCSFTNDEILQSKLLPFSFYIDKCPEEYRLEQEFTSSIIILKKREREREKKTRR